MGGNNSARFYCFGTLWWLWWIVGSRNGGDDVKPELSHCRVHLPECSSDSGGAIRSIYTLLWAWKTVLSLSVMCLNNFICILGLNIQAFEYIVSRFMTVPVMKA